jgi:hypothetical protein
VTDHLPLATDNLMLGANCDNRYMSPYGLIDCRLAPNIGLEKQLLAIGSWLLGKPKPAQAGMSASSEDDV